MLKNNLWDTINNIFNNEPKIWNYYNINLNNPLEGKEQAAEFIYKYFKYACKINLFIDIDGQGIGRNFSRNIHTAIVFFIGAGIQLKIDPALYIKSRIRGDEEQYLFSYIWYLTCLAHDFGYIFEENDYNDELEYMKDCVSYLNKYNLVDDFYKKCILNKNVHSPQKGGVVFYDSYFDMVKFSNEKLIAKPFYSYRTINNYFRYRLFEMDKVDHGILGGQRFYSELSNIYKEKKYSNRSNLYCYPKRENSNRQIKFYSDQKRIWKYIRNCIQAHNIYKASESSRDIYIKYGLDELLPENYNKIAYENNPVLFILCLADTIEPTKKFVNDSSEYILKNISVNYDNQNNRLNIKVSKKLQDKTGYNSYINSVKELSDWCDVTIKFL